jgi:hypothetical protein
MYRASGAIAQVLDAYEGMQDEEAAQQSFETSELRLYQALIFEEGGELEGALKGLRNHEVWVPGMTGSSTIHWVDLSSLLRIGDWWLLGRTVWTDQISEILHTTHAGILNA